MLKKILILFFILAVITTLSCDIKKLFEQPAVTVDGFSLKELPGDTTLLDIDVTITNQDKRDGQIGLTTYKAVIEGIESKEMTYKLNETILSETPLATTLPLELPTEGAAYLLNKLKKDEPLNFSVVGTAFEENRGLYLPLEVEGTATVEVGYEDYFNQPEVTVNNITGTYSINGFPPTSYTFDLMVDCDVQNMDSHSATIDEVVYTVYLEGVPSEEETYIPDPLISIDENGGTNDTVTIDLPVVFNTTNSEGLTIIAGASDDGQVSYIVEGTFHALTEIDEESMDFYLPLYVTGETSATLTQN